MKILSVNCGSSSLKFQAYEMPEEKVLMSGYFEKIGLDKSMCDMVTELGRKYNVRRVIIHKNTPMYIIAGDLIKLI